MSFSWNLRRYEKGDETGIVQLLHTAFGRWRGLEYWKWWYMRNPSGPPIIWLAEHDGKIIGHYGVVPIRMKLGCSYITGSFSCNGATHPKYQGKGVFSSIVNRCYPDVAEKGLPLTYGFAQAGLGATYKRYEWRGHICYLVDMIRVLDWEHFLGKYVRSRLLARASAKVLRTVRRRSSVVEGLKITNINRFDDRFDRFWEEVSGRFMISVKKDHLHLNWRYADNPKQKYRIFAAVEHDRILGYCVLSESTYDNLRIGSIDDVLGFQDGHGTVQSLISFAVEYFDKRNVDHVSCMMTEEHPYRAVFKKLGFVATLRQRKALYATVNLPGKVTNNKEAYSQALLLSQSSFLKDKGNWVMMSGDGN